MVYTSSSLVEQSTPESLLVSDANATVANLSLGRQNGIDNITKPSTFVVLQSCKTCYDGGSEFSRHSLGMV